MFAASNNTSRLTAVTFAVLMTVVVHGSMLLTFEVVAKDAELAQSAQARNVAVLETVTIVGQRI